MKEREEHQKSHRDALAYLEQVRNEIKNSGLSEKLQNFIEKKEFELSTIKMTLKAQHAQKINAIYSQEISHWQEMLSLCFDYLQQLYLLNRATGNLDKAMEEKVTKLVRLCQGRQKVVRFLEDASEYRVANEFTFGIDDSPGKTLTMSASRKRPNSNGNEQPLASISGNSYKMPKLNIAGADNFVKPKTAKAIDFYVHQPSQVKQKLETTKAGDQQKNANNVIQNLNKNGNVFKVPHIEPIKPSLDETRVTIGSENELNTTFSLTSGTKFISNVLTENTVNTNEPNIVKVVRPATGANKNLLNRAAITLSKENKKFTPRKPLASKTPKKMGINGKLWR